MKLQNSFAGGTVGVGQTEYPSPYTVDNLHWESTVTGVAVMDGREFNGYIRRFTSWTNPDGFNSGSVSSSLPVLQLNYNTITEFTANLSPEFNITFQNNLLGTTSGGQIKVNGSTYNAPYVAHTLGVTPPQGVTGESVYQVINGIEYIFRYWTNTFTSDTVWSSSSTFYPNNHVTYTAHFSAKPRPVQNFSTGGSVGSPVQLTWSEHPNQLIDHYKIWRQVKRKNAPEPDPPQSIATVLRGTTNYTDYGYEITDGYTTDLVWYDARARWSFNDTYADAQWYANFARTRFEPKQQLSEGRGEPPQAYSIAAYPNPFNPSTVIAYSLPQDGSVSLVIYDVQGRKVITLVDGYRKTGFYNTTWNGSNSLGAAVSSGIYFARLEVTGSAGELLHTHTDKLLLAR
jgi:hypothetical protein